MKMNDFVDVGKTNPICRGVLSGVALAKTEASGEAGSNPIFPKFRKISVLFSQSKLHFFERKPLTNPVTICACITAYFIG